MLSDLTVEVVDDKVNGDAFHIVARPRGPITILIIYDQGGPLVRGDIVVFGPALQPDAWAKGYGAIAVGDANLGRFDFRSVRFGTP